MMGKNPPANPGRILKTRLRRAPTSRTFRDEPTPDGGSVMLKHGAGPNGRSAGPVSWGGFNTYYWLVRAKTRHRADHDAGLPFADKRT